MDHTPGQRQFTDLTQLKRYLRGKYSMTEAEIAAHIGFQQTLGARVRDAHEGAAVAAARRYGATLASHDDTTAEHVARSAAHGVGLAEFPTTRAAAEACRAHGIAVMMGAPNLIRGGSHSGNVAAEELAQAGLIDVLSSDYVPAGLLIGAFALGAILGDTARGIAAASAAPAAAAGLADRGRLVPGLRADVIRIADEGPLPRLRGVWSEGKRVA
jgi:alpha-D-ribose 1-methylphosphonate 5-triphosphate diphosphatase